MYGNYYMCNEYMIVFLFVQRTFLGVFYGGLGIFTEVLIIYKQCVQKYRKMHIK